MFDLLEKVLPIPEYPGLYYFICIAMFVRGCVLISEWYWARERARGPEYFQALSFSGEFPQGEVSYHEAFSAQG